MRLFAAAGLDDFRTSAATYRSETTRASVLPGLHFRLHKLDVKVFVGGDFEMRVPLRPALESPITLFGVRTSIDVWWEPANDWMVSASASATTIESGLSARLATGWRLPWGWIGPEGIVNHDKFNTQWRAGAHLSGLRVGITEWSVAGGYVQDSYRRDGAYGRLGVTLRP